jgi:type II secretory pathway predicted ATPase ExeA
MHTDRQITSGASAPDSYALYMHQSLQKAYAYLQYALYNGEGLMLITGQPGTGKTALLTQLMREKDQYDHDFTAVDCASFSGDELMRLLADRWSINHADTTVAQRLASIHNHLAQQARFGKTLVLLLDEAQFLTDDALEVVRLLGNLSLDGHALLQIVLVGQPSLRTRLLQPEFAQLHQRIIATSSLDAMSSGETREYVVRQLQRADWQNCEDIPVSVFTAIHRASQGIPRWINLICNRMMIQAIANERLHFSLEDICVVLCELVSEDLLPIQFRMANRAIPTRPAHPQTDEKRTARLEVAA